MGVARLLNRFLLEYFLPPGTKENGAVARPVYVVGLNFSAQQLHITCPAPPQELLDQQLGLVFFQRPARGGVAVDTVLRGQFREQFQDLAALGLSDTGQ